MTAHAGPCAGSSTGEVYVWRYGQATALAGYTPMAASGSAPSRESAPSLFTAPLRAWQLAPGVPSAQWGQPQAVSLLEHSRFRV